MCNKGSNGYLLKFFSLPMALLLAACAATAPAPRAGTASQTQQTLRPLETGAAFKLEIEGADQALRTLVQRHTLLQRWRDTSELDATETARLMALAERDTRELLATQGHFAADVHATLRHDNDGEPVIRIAIAAGPQASISDVRIRFSGDIATDQDPAVQAQRGAITAGWSLPAGQGFTQERWDEAKTAALRALVAQRYALGRLGASSATVSQDGTTVALRIELDSGPTFRLGAANVVGASRYPPELATRLSWLRTGEIYSQQALVQAQQRLMASGYYDSAYLSIAPQDRPEATPLTYAVTEAKRQKVQLGAGYSTDSAGARLTLEHRDNTALGTTWRADTRLNLERRQPLVQLQLTSLPDEAGWRRATFARHMRQDDGTLVTTSDTLRIGQLQSTERIDRNVYLQYDQASVAGAGGARVPAALIGDGAAISANIAWTRRRFRDLPNPTHGWGLGLELGAGMTTMGTRRPFVHVGGHWLGFVPLAGGSSRLQLRAQAGAVVAKMDARLPATYLFRTGGDTTVRGYSLRSIGLPVGANLVAPGRFMTVGSIEWQRPILQQRFPGLLEHVVFVDVGSVSNHIGDLHGQWGVGTGLRLITPVGPMQVDVARGLQAHAWRLHINVGLNF